MTQVTTVIKFTETTSTTTVKREYPLEELIDAAAVHGKRLLNTKNVILEVSLRDDLVLEIVTTGQRVQ
jgi:anti-sigma regulatory factor (Ser/Thr protein kinase)